MPYITNNIKSMTMAQAFQMINNNNNILIIDVRTTNEYNRGHISGSINIPIDDIDTITDIITDRKAKLFIHCASGSRSNRASHKLISMGYVDVTNIGALSDWPGELITD